MTRAVATILVLLLVAPAASWAACPKTSLADVENEVMCPVCGVPLGLATESPQARRERAFIQREADACRSKHQIKHGRGAQDGTRGMGQPPGEGGEVDAERCPAATERQGAQTVT